MLMSSDLNLFKVQYTLWGTGFADRVMKFSLNQLFFF